MKLPFPASHLSPQPIPPERRPQPGRLEGPFEPNTALRAARRLFQGRVIGSGAARCTGLEGALWFDIVGGWACRLPAKLRP